METILESINNHPAFDSLPDSDLDYLAHTCVRKALKKEEVLVLQGDDWPYLFLVLDGELVALKGSSEGRNLIITTFRAGELFWGSAFFQTNSPQLATLQANNQTTVLLWSFQSIEPIFLRNAKMSWKLCQMMMQRMQRASDIVNDLAFLSVSSRLAQLLLDHFASTGDETLDRSLTLDDLAARIGTTREMVCRVLYRFADKDLIKVTRTEFVLTDRTGLAHMIEVK